MTDNKQKIYISFDIEADGPSPEINSMISFGLVAFDKTKEIFSYQANIKPRADRCIDERCIEEFWNQNLEMWDFVNSDQISPEKFALDIENILIAYKDYDITWTGYPAAYDWQWLNAYYNKYKSENAPNIGYSAKCTSTMLWAYCKINKIAGKEEKATLWNELSENYKLTHNPEDDARAQGYIFMNLSKKLGIAL